MNVTADDQLVPLSRASEVFPPNECPNYATLFRWIHEGHRAPSGRRVHLRATRLGKRWFISREIVRVFGRELAEASLAQRPRRAVASV